MPYEHLYDGTISTVSADLDGEGQKGARTCHWPRGAKQGPPDIETFLQAPSPGCRTDAVTMAE